MVKKRAHEEDVTDVGLNLDEFEKMMESSEVTNKASEFDEEDSAPEARHHEEDIHSEIAEESFASTQDVVDEMISVSSDLPVKLVAVMGQKSLSLKDLLKLKIGQAIQLDRAPNEFVDLYANGKMVARGELVDIDGKLGVRIIKMLK